MNSVSYTPFGPEYDCIMDGWEPKEDRDGAIYFSNSQQRTTSWTQPYLDKLLEEMSEYNEIRYAAYRTALKLRFLQLKTGLGWITLRGIKKVFSSTRDSNDNSYRECTVSHKETFNIVNSILEESNTLCLNRSHFAKASDTIVNLLIELYDPNYEGKIAIPSLKISLTALCSAQLSEKYRFFFSEVYNYDDQKLQRERLLYLFYDLMQLVEVLKESTAFGTNVSVAVDSCLNYHLVPSEVGRSSEDAFYSWLLLEPQIIVWLPTLHRVAATENVCHNAQCSSCGINPLKGFRYRCLLCFGYDLCQNCFFHGNVSLTHKIKHPVQEYCLPATTTDKTKAVFKILRNKISKKHRGQSKIPYLPIDDDSITGSVFQWQPRPKRPNPRDIICGSNDSGLACHSESDTITSVDCSSHVHVEDKRVIRNPRRHSDVETKGIDQLSKIDMTDQQYQMTRLIEELQEENRYLLEKLNILTRKKSSDVDCTSSLRTGSEASGSDDAKNGSARGDNNDPGVMTVHDEEGLSPIVISHIEHNKSEDEVLQTSDDKKCDSQAHSGDEDSLPKLMDIVGYYTPVRSSFCEDQLEDEEHKDIVKNNPKDEAEVVESPVAHAASEPLKCVHEVEVNIHSKVDSEVMSTTTWEKDDVTSESTVSGGLEYGYSDMSLHSENISQKTDIKEKETLVPRGKAFTEKEPVHFSEKLSTPKCSSEDDRTLDDNNLLKKRMIEISTSPKDEIKTNSVQPSNASTGMKTSDQGHPGSTHIPISSEMNSELFFNISDILPEGSALPALSYASNKPLTPVNNQPSERRLTIEPVYMSTPVVGLDEPQSSEPMDKAEKENRVPVRKKEKSLRLIASYKCKMLGGVTPQSALLLKQNKRLLSLCDSLSTDCRSDSMNLSHREVGMTTMFDKAERLGAFEATSVGDSLAHGDKEEMEKLMQKLDVASVSSREYHQRKPDIDSSSMLNAVLNVGDAMGDLVQATAELHKK